MKRVASIRWDRLKDTRSQQSKIPINSWRKMRQLLRGKFLPVNYKQYIYTPKSKDVIVETGSKQVPSRRDLVIDKIVEPKDPTAKTGIDYVSKISVLVLEDVVKVNEPIVNTYKKFKMMRRKRTTR